MEQKQVKIIGLSVNKKFGGLEATELKLTQDYLAKLNTSIHHFFLLRLNNLNNDYRS